VLAAAGLLGAIIVVALLAPWITPYDPQKMDIINRLKPPGSAHWFGSDEFGRDVLARVMLGARLSLLVGFLVVIVATPRVARVVRAATLVVRERQFVEAAIALGASTGRTILVHVLPNLISPIIVQATFIFAFAILTEAALSFLGVGVPPTTPTWGNMIAGAQQYFRQADWLILFPGFAIVLTVLSLQMVGDGLRDALDPKLQKVT
jgi:peptide/nickel transport system permease protein